MVFLAVIRPPVSLASFNSRWIPRHQTRSTRHYTPTSIVIVKAADEVEPVPALEFAALTQAQLEQEASWLSDMIRLWLDEEWTPQEIHRQLGDAAGSAYRKLRRSGQDEAGDVVLGIASELLAVDFREAFVGPFDVANKSVELLMMRAGCEVCCTSDADNEQIERYEQQLREENNNN